MTTAKLHRKTHAMLLLEYKHGGRAIDLVILDAIVDAQGQFKEASRNLGLHNSTLSRWIQELGLVPQAVKIRQQFGLKDLASVYGEVHVEVDGNSLKLSNKISGDCISCKINFKDLPAPLDIVSIEEKEKRGRIVRGMYVEIRDSLRRTHWFLLDKVKLLQDENED